MTTKGGMTGMKLATAVFQRWRRSTLKGLRGVAVRKMVPLRVVRQIGIRK